MDELSIIHLFFGSTYCILEYTGPGKSYCKFLYIDCISQYVAGTESVCSYHSLKFCWTFFQTHQLSCNTLKGKECMSQI